MPKHLTKSDIDELRACVESRQRIEYYCKLEAFGYGEASLSYLVAADKGFIGRFANRYAESVALTKGLYLSDVDWRDVGDSLMDEDFSARLAKFNEGKINAPRGSPEETIAVDLSLEYSDYRAYHAAVFDTVKCSLDKKNETTLGVEAWASELVVGNAPKELTHPMWWHLGNGVIERRNQISQIRHLFGLIWADKNRELDVEGDRDIFEASSVVAGMPFAQVLFGDENFYSPKRWRPRPPRRR